MKPKIPYLTIPQDTCPLKLMELTPEKYSEIKAASEKIYEYLYYKRRLIEININKNEYFNTIDQYQSIYNQSIVAPIDFDFKEEAYINLNRCFNNFVASFDSFIEHCEDKVKSIFGKDSKQIIEFKKFESGLYDQYFSYRFLKRIRNYSIHANYALDYVSFFSRVLDNTGNKKSYELEVFCSRDKFLSNTILRQKLGKDLLILPSKIDISDYLNEVVELLPSVLKKFIQIAEVKIIESATILSELSAKTNQPNLSITIMEIIDSKINHDSKILPIEISQELIKLIDD